MKESNEAEVRASYRSIFKSSSLFGGVQLYQVLVLIVKSKLIAVLLGPLGVGIQGLYQSAIMTVQQLTSFGLSQSAVRNVAESYATGDEDGVGRTVTALRKIVWITGILGMACVILFSPLLSHLSFGNLDYILPFIFLSIILLLDQINAGQKVILQGTRQLKSLAKCSTIGVTIGLLVSIPLYYKFGIKSIVPNLVLSSISALVLSSYYSRKVHFKKVELSNKEALSLGRTMLTMGLAMSATTLIATLSSYVLRTSIRMCGGIEEVGLFSAGYVLMSQYTGMVFTAMGTDYYPRLSGVSKDDSKSRELMNQQGEIGLLVLTPLMLCCITFVPVIVEVLYSKDFSPVNPYVIWCAGGMLFKMVSWCISYQFVAKGESKLFFVNELTAGIYTLIMNVLGYRLGGLAGLGISFSISYLVYLIQVYIIAHKKYAFTFTGSFEKLFIFSFILLFTGIVVVVLLPTSLKYIVGVLLIIVSSYYSVKELNTRIDILPILKRKK